MIESTMLTGMSLAWGLGDLFLKPMPLWNLWWVLLLPLCLGVAIVYKAVRLDNIRDLPRQGLILLFWILGGMIFAAIVLAVLVNGLE